MKEKMSTIVSSPAQWALLAGQNKDFYTKQNPQHMTVVGV